MTELWERWFGEDVQGITGWWEARIYINIAYNTLNSIEVPEIGLKPFSKNVSNRKLMIDAISFKDAVPELGDKG